MTPDLKQLLLDLAHFKHDDLSIAIDAKYRIEELERQLVELKEELRRARLQNAIVYGTSHPEIYKTVEDELREQVTLLRDALTDAVAALEHRWEVVANRAAPIMESVIDAAHTKGIEALADTEPKEMKCLTT